MKLSNFTKIGLVINLWLVLFLITNLLCQYLDAYANSLSSIITICLGISLLVFNMLMLISHRMIFKKKTAYL